MFSINMTMWESSPILCVYRFLFICLHFICHQVWFSIFFLHILFLSRTTKIRWCKKQLKYFRFFFAFKEGYNEQFFNVNLDFLGGIFFFQNACFFFHARFAQQTFNQGGGKSLSKRNFFFISEIRLYFFKIFFEGGSVIKKLLKTRCAWSIG